MKNPLQILMLTVLTGGVVATVPAQTLSIPIGQQAPNLRAEEVPVRGMATGNVETRYGAPYTKSSPVGQPPISYWEYSDYYVYFEHDRVLHTVLKQGR